MKTGDVVCLKSGGPHMTVSGSIIANEGPNRIHVSYFIGDGQMHSAEFKETMLRLIATDEPEEFGLPSALQKAKDDEAQRLQDEKDRQWAEDQVRYAASEGYVTEQ